MLPSLVMLPILPLIQKTKMMLAMRRRLRIVIIVPMMILRFLLTGFFSFFIFLPLWLTGSLATLSSPDCSSKSKAWTGFKKSSAELVGAVLVLGSDGVGVTMGFGEVILAGLVVLVAGFLAVTFLGVVLVEVFLVVLVALVVVFLAVEEAVAFLGRRGARPSIDLFLSIVYNYNIMALKLTKKQLAVLEFLEDFTEREGYSPSYREMMAGLGLSSVSAVAEHVDNLVNKGVLRKVPGAARSLEILDYKHEETVELFKERMAGCTGEEKQVLTEAAGILGLDLG